MDEPRHLPPHLGDGALPVEEDDPAPTSLYDYSDEDVLDLLYELRHDK